MVDAGRMEGLVMSRSQVVRKIRGIARRYEDRIRDNEVS